MKKLNISFLKISTLKRFRFDICQTGILPVILISLSVSITSCKPTEKGYKAAYDAALNKREAATASQQADLSTVGVTAIQTMDGPQLKKIGDYEVYVLSERLKPIDDSDSLRKFNVAVACYKMPTNCIAQVKDLRDAGKAAYGAKTGDDKFYVIEEGFDNLEEAAAYAAETARNKERAFIGLPGAPVIIRK